MSKVTKLGAAFAVLAASLAGPVQAVDIESPYANQTPYVDPGATPPVMAPPAGYEMFFLETVSRHGSRSMTSTGAETRTLKVWKSAKAKGKLTTLGQRFDDDLTEFQAAERAVGYGKLTDQGKAEWRGIGERTADNYESFLDGLAPENITYVTSTYERTRQSANAMSAGINSVIPDLPTYLPTDADENKALLELPNGSTKAGRSAISKIKRSYDVRLAAKHVLRTIYTKSFVDSLDAPVSTALDIYVLYSTGPAMADHTVVDFADYVPVADALWLGYVKDAEKFYEYGPGVAGQTNSYIKARPLRSDFFSKLDARIAGGSTAAVFRHGHGETTVPFAALIRVPGSDVHASTKSYYKRSNNPWRGRIAGVPAGSIEWAAYKNDADKVLVTMRHNERPVKFRSACTPSEPNGYFYDVNELKDCLY